MALPTQAALQALIPASPATLDPAMFVRRLSAMAPGATVEIGTASVTLTAGAQSVTADLPSGVTFAVPATVVRSIATANAPVAQSGKAPANATD
ncbi:hypothetical protein IGS75_01440 [Gluconobacter sphaericus]|uniref:hypothetical protein n=1 Tax=Gluconobacter sphaericus TaxID=574987 RepID=UPI0019228D4A|nr:hypothetical protein [Gluconobacter sphaericus]QQX91334.1 hypothetical protein IGS75_01440 [Gluconobacter sphaericus]